MHFKLQGLYAITDEILTPEDVIFKKVLTALRAGVCVIQYRNKTQSDYKVELICTLLQELCRTFNVPFIIDDRPYLAQKIGADGLHIGKDDMPLAEARAIFTKGIIGVSCYGSLTKAKEAESEGADYVAFGSFFHSPTKPKSGIVSKSVIQKAKELLRIPVCVIGGINQENIHEIVQENPDMISVVSAIFDGDIKQNVHKLLQKMS
jgi:thiamine-phosphate pyrophosphorylase